MSQGGAKKFTAVFRLDPNFGGLYLGFFEFNTENMHRIERTMGIESVENLIAHRLATGRGHLKVTGLSYGTKTKFLTIISMLYFVQNNPDQEKLFMGKHGTFLLQSDRI